MKKIIYGLAGVFQRSPISEEGGNINSEDNGKKKNTPLYGVTQNGYANHTIDAIYLFAL